MSEWPMYAVWCTMYNTMVRSESLWSFVVLHLVWISNRCRFQIQIWTVTGNDSFSPTVRRLHQSIGSLFPSVAAIVSVHCNCFLVIGLVFGSVCRVSVNVFATKENSKIHDQSRTTLAAYPHQVRTAPLWLHAGATLVDSYRPSSIDQYGPWLDNMRSMSGGG